VRAATGTAVGIVPSGTAVTRADVGIAAAGSADTGVGAASIVEVGTGVGSGVVVGSGWEHETIPATNDANTAMARLFLMMAAPLTRLPSGIYSPLLNIGAAA